MCIRIRRACVNYTSHCTVSSVLSFTPSRQIRICRPCNTALSICLATRPWPHVVTSSRVHLTKTPLMQMCHAACGIAIPAQIHHHSPSPSLSIALTAPEFSVFVCLLPSSSTRPTTMFRAHPRECHRRYDCYITSWPIVAGVCRHRVVGYRICPQNCSLKGCKRRLPLSLPFLFSFVTTLSTKHTKYVPSPILGGATQLITSSWL